jgi:hypothetical protein
VASGSPFFILQGIDISNTTKKPSNRLTVIKTIIKPSHLAGFQVANKEFNISIRSAAINAITAP